jgi:hypothetical protein
MADEDAPAEAGTSEEPSENDSGLAVQAVDPGEAEQEQEAEDMDMAEQMQEAVEMLEALAEDCRTDVLDVTAVDV